MKLSRPDNGDRILYTRVVCIKCDDVGRPCLLTLQAPLRSLKTLCEYAYADGSRKGTA